MTKPGANNEGCWNLANAVIQLENMDDCCAVMYPDVHFVTSYDNSQNHQGKRECGLHIKSMNKGYRGVQPRMDASQVLLSVIRPALFENKGVKLLQGALQAMFEGKDVCPYWMTPHTWLEKKHTQLTQVNSKPRSCCKVSSFKLSETALTPHLLRTLMGS
jgi:hypothetical protein